MSCVIILGKDSEERDKTCLDNEKRCGKLAPLNRHCFRNNTTTINYSSSNCYNALLVKYPVRSLKPVVACLVSLQLLYAIFDTKSCTTTQLLLCIRLPQIHSINPCMCFFLNAHHPEPDLENIYLFQTPQAAGHGK